MADKVKPTRRLKRFEKYNCSGKLKVKVEVNDEGDIEEIYLMAKGGGCKSNLELIGRLLTLCCECHIDMNYVLEQLRKTTPCTAPLLRTKREDLPKEEVGLGGCSRIILAAMETKIKELEAANDKTKKE